MYMSVCVCVCLFLDVDDHTTSYDRQAFKQ